MPSHRLERFITKRYTLDDFARLFDHTNLQPDATDADMRKLCDEALENHFCMVAINSGQSARCHAMLDGTDIHVGAAIGFPLGQTSIACKTFETKDALAAGSDEIDYVVNLTEVKEGNWTYVTEEMRSIVDACREETDRRSVLVPSKVIFENCLLTRDEKLKLCEIAREVEPTWHITARCAAPPGSARPGHDTVANRDCLAGDGRPCRRSYRGASGRPRPSS